MRTGIQFLGYILVVGGIIAMAGSGNDCDGKCMETANTLGEMLVVVAYGMVALIAGATILLKTAR
jgi:hypothetical protein